MTLVQLKNSPIGTTEINSGENEHCPTGKPEMRFMAMHYERTSRGVRPRIYYAATEAEALEKAKAYDKTRKEKFQQ